MKIIIENDLFGIAERLKSCDSDYAVYYETESGKFELHNLRCRPTFQLCFPYAELDSRAYEYALKTRSARIMREIEEIDAYNENLRQSIEKNACFEACEKLGSLIGYIGRGGKDLPEYGEI